LTLTLVKEEHENPLGLRQPVEPQTPHTWFQNLGKYSKTAKFLLDEEKVLEEIKDNWFKDKQLRSCKKEFKEFERQDVKYREDLKHMKQKIKKLDDKLENARKIFV
jgi:predicted RNase H-like nuclease (RuvC/YqgF family)